MNSIISSKNFTKQHGSFVSSLSNSAGFWESGRMSILSKITSGVCVAQIVRLTVDFFHRIESDVEPYLIYAPLNNDTERVILTDLTNSLLSEHSIDIKSLK